VVTVSIVLLLAESLNARFLKALRVLRAVRPLRMLTRSQSMLMVFHTLVRSLAAMGNVTGGRQAWQLGLACSRSCACPSKCPSAALPFLFPALPFL